MREFLFCLASFCLSIPAFAQNVKPQQLEVKQSVIKEHLMPLPAAQQHNMTSDIKQLQSAMIQREILPLSVWIDDVSYPADSLEALKKRLNLYQDYHIQTLMQDSVRVLKFYKKKE